MSVITKPSSKVVIIDEEIPDGLLNVSLSNDATYKNIHRGTLSFVDGESSVLVDDLTPNSRYVGHVINEDYTKGAVVVGRSIGQIECYSNETFVTRAGYIENVSDINVVGSNKVGLNQVAVTDNGALLTIRDNGAIVYAPNNAFNHLNPDEEATDTCPLYLNEVAGPTILDNSLATAPDGGWVLQSNGRWTSDDGGVKGKTLTFPVSVIENETYDLTVTRNLSTATGSNSGSFSMYWANSAGEVLGYTRTIVGASSGDELVLRAATVPTGAVAIVFKAPTTGGADLTLTSLSRIRLENVDTSQLDPSISGTVAGWKYGDFGYMDAGDTTVITPISVLDPSMTTDVEYEISFDLGRPYSLSSSSTTGRIYFHWVDTNGDILGDSVYDISAQAEGQNHLVNLGIPVSGAAGYAIAPADGTRSRIRILNFRPVKLPDSYTFSVRVLASKEVGTELNDSKSWAGANWSGTGGTYTHSAGSTAPLTASFTGLKADNVYQLSLELSGVTQGSVQVAIGNNTARYGLAQNESDVWMIRAGSTTEAINIIPTSDFDGTVKGITVRELINKFDFVSDVEWIEATGDAGSMYVEWKLPTVSKFSDSQAIEFDYTQGYEFSSEFGIRKNEPISTMRVHDVEFTAKRSAVSLKGGNWVECENVKVVGGYPEGSSSWAFQTGFVFADNGATPMNRSYFNHCRVNLLLAPMTDNYVTQNSDGAVINAGTSAFDTQAYFYDFLAEGIPDGCIDSKGVGVFVNQASLFGGHRGLRGHGDTHNLYMNSYSEEELNTQAAFHPAYATCRFNLFNVEMKNIRCLSNSQMLAYNDPVKEGGVFTGPPIQTDNVTGTDALVVMKTYPKVPDFARPAMTDLEFQSSTDSGASWQPLGVERTNEQGVIGFNERTITMPADTYKIRVRSKNHSYVGAWVESDSVVVS